MTYDDWKLESPEDEEDRLNGPRRRRQARLEYLADQRDEFLEAEQMEKNNDDNLCSTRRFSRMTRTPSKRLRHGFKRIWKPARK